MDGEGPLVGQGERTFGPSALFTPANVVTGARLVVSPMLWAAIIAWGAGWGTFSIWATLTATDAADGWVARRQGTTRSGAFLDPLADKALVLGGLVALAVIGRFWWLPVGLIALREIAVSIWRTVWGRRGVSLPASTMAKWKTALQSSAVGAAVFPLLADDPAWPADVLLIVALVFTVISGAQYLTARIDAREV
ncbi:MAG: CDP-diacylglycerol--glycerol-3-phosphate 3-phosphatidyltransferase [Acidimicrobiales bacterium]|nr:MAG: CDP-diacylglycerol--glycerol-3-phosphate 3-phosphatidyltransferase [Acidimicrobiales bacterium]